MYDNRSKIKVKKFSNLIFNGVFEGRVLLWRVQFNENVILMSKACIEVIIFCQHDLLEFYHI